jgi:glycosyltransferase involved in cell wall biosynthesis
MKIIQVSASYKPAYVYGGPTMSVSKLSEELVKVGTDLEVICTTANGKDELPVTPGNQTMVDGVRVTYYKRLTKDHSHFSPALYAALWKKAKPDTIVHIQAWWNLVSVFSCAISLLRGAPTVISARGTLSSYSFNNRTSLPKKLFHLFIGRPLLKRSHFHVTSEKEKQDILNLINPKSISVIPNFVRLPTPAVSQKKDFDNNFKFLFLSRVEEKKGIELLFESLANLRGKWTLTIAGTGLANYVEELKTLSDKLNIADKIAWVGHLANEVKFDVMKSHHLMILPSFDENFANVVIECLAVGTPVLISENVGLADYVKANNLGWVCKRSMDSILQNLNYIIANPSALNYVNSIAPDIIYNDFKEDKIIELYKELYTNIENTL